MGLEKKQPGVVSAGHDQLTTQERRRKAWGMNRAAGVTSRNRIGILQQRPSRLKPGHPFARVNRLDRWLVHAMLKVVGHPPVRISLWDGVVINDDVRQPVASLQFHDRMALLKTMLDPELHFGDMFCSGRLDFSGELVEFLQTIFRQMENAEKGGPFRRLIIWLGHRRIANSLSRARDNIQHHYDLGNDFYSLWLDEEAMQYTCAYYPRQALSLEQAQQAKLHHICRKLQLKPGDTVVEAGCGWGGLARFMARHYGVKVTAYNISKEQVRYAREQARREGLEEQVEYVLDDYRNISGQYDAFVSVGMLEHVGARDYRQLGEVIRRCLKAEGVGLIHTIGRNTPRPMNAWIERRIFPGAYPPTLREMMDIFEPNNFSLQDVENLRQHYALTLRDWLQRYDRHEEQVEAMMDKEFVKAWRLYLAGSLAAFTSGELQLFQVVFTFAGNNSLPRSRAHLYEDSDPEWPRKA